jgi:ribose transport system permease protein
MKKNAGLFILLLSCCAITALINQRFLHPINIENLLRRTALFSILSIGVSFVITTAGIDLSLGSMVCLIGTLLPFLCVHYGLSPLLAIVILLGSAIILGFLQGTLVTRIKLQPFVVTLCGLLIFRGLARGITNDQTQGFGSDFESLRSLSLTRYDLFGLSPISIPSVTIIALFIALSATLLMNRTPFGIYLRAIGQNPKAAFYSGLNTSRLTTLAYTLSSFFAGLAGIFFVLDVNSAQPADFGNFYELYAIAAAVLGGCSLRGGEWSMAGILIGTALMQVLRNAIVLIGIPTQLEFAIIGSVILIGVFADKVMRGIDRE